MKISDQNMGNQRAKLLKKFSDEIDNLKSYDPKIVENVNSEYVDKIFESLKNNPNAQNNKVLKMKILILGKQGHGKSKLVNLVLKQNIGSVSSSCDTGTYRPVEYIIKRDNIELYLIDVDGYGEGVDYINHRDKIRSLVYIHKPSVIWYLRLGEDIRMSNREVKEYFTFHELQVPVVFILNKVEEKREKEIIKQWETNLEDEKCLVVINKILGIPFIGELNEYNKHIDKLIIESLNCAILNKNYCEFIVKTAKRRLWYYSLLCVFLSPIPGDIIVTLPILCYMIYDIFYLFNYNINSTMVKNILNLFMFRILAYASKVIMLDIAAFIPFATPFVLALNATMTYGFTLKFGLTLISTLEFFANNNTEQVEFNEEFKELFLEKLEEIDKLTIDELKNRVGQSEDDCILCMENRSNVKNISCGHSTFCTDCLPEYFRNNFNKCSQCQTIMNVDEMKRKYNI